MGTVIGNLDDPRLMYDYTDREYGTIEPDEGRDRFQWVSEVAYKNVHRIVTRGYDTTELVEAGYDVADIIFINFQSRIPLVTENQMLNYVMVLMLEDGLSSPAAIARIVAKSRTLLTQAAGASILAFGHAYGAYQSFGRLLDEYLAIAEKEGITLEEAAKKLVEKNLYNDALGVSGLYLKDPAAKRCLARCEKLGVAGKYTAFMKEIVKAAQKASQEPVDIDMMGATGAVMMDIGFSPESTWAIIAITRAFGSGAHYCEELEREEPVKTAQTLTPKEDYDGPADRPVPSLKERTKSAASGVTFTPEEWKKSFVEKQKLVGSGWAIVEEIDDPKRKMQKSNI